MEFPNELKELFPNEIVEVRGNAEALTIILGKEIDIKVFAKKLETKFVNLNYTYDLFLHHEDSHDFLKLTLK
ncbi:hypothetical protein ABIB40_001939 [Pedobacter sp. UYP30]|uniref:hypothetical protein n=1 Tax=Pedobacter sp. UYP30 TaxID=1756400 RepID=UPI003391F4B4